MKKAMLSQPMAGKTEQEIVETRENAIAALNKRGYKVGKRREVVRSSMM